MVVDKIGMILLREGVAILGKSLEEGVEEIAVKMGAVIIDSRRYAEDAEAQRAEIRFPRGCLEEKAGVKVPQKDLKLDQM